MSTSTMSGPTTTLSTAAVEAGRWRFASAYTVDGTEENTMSSPSASYAVAEMYIAGPVPTSGAVQTTLFPASATTAPVRRWVARKDLEAMTASGIRVPTLLSGDEEVAWYQPVGTRAFIGEPDPKDVRQGKKIGDCRLMSAMQALAATRGGRARLKKIIVPGDQSGTFTVLLRTDLRKGAPGGGFEYVTVDNYFPVTRDEGSVLYALYGRTTKSKDEFPIWPALLQKAMAFALGGYPGVEDAMGMDRTRLVDDTIFAMLGIGTYGTPPKRTCMGQPEVSISSFVTTAAAAGATIVAASGVHRHNWAVVGSDKDGVCLSDPHSASTPKAHERWKKPYRPGKDEAAVLKNSNYEKIPDSDRFPVYLTWERVAEYVQSMSRYDTPPPVPEGKGTDTSEA